MPALTPGKFEREVRKVVAALGHLTHEYRWAHGVAYGRQVTEQAHVSNAQRDPDGDMLRAAAAGLEYDPQRSVAFDHSSLRNGLNDVAKLVKRVRRDAEKKTDMLKARMEKDERRHGPLFDEVRNPRTETRDDLAARYAAQHRRRERGEATPT